MQTKAPPRTAGFVLAESPTKVEPRVWTLFYLVACVLGTALGAAVLAVLVVALDHQ
jgi:hypothetical protein